MPYWVLAEGRGTAQTARVVGPYANLQAMQSANPGFAGLSMAVVGNQSGYPNQLAAQQEANSFNHSSVSSKVQQVGGTVGGLPSIPNPLDIFHGLNIGNILLRVGEVVLGVVLIAVGLAKITGADNLIASTLKTKMPVPI